MTHEEKLQEIARLNPWAKIPDDCDGGLIGYVTTKDGECLALYDAEKTIESLVEAFGREEGETDEEVFASAADWFSYNTLGTIVTDWPVFVGSTGEDKPEYQLLLLPLAKSGNDKISLEDMTFVFFDQQDEGPVSHID